MAEITFTRYITRTGEPVWVLFRKRWRPATVNYIGIKKAHVVFTDPPGGDRFYLFGDLRKRRPELNGSDRPTNHREPAKA